MMIARRLLSQGVAAVALAALLAGAGACRDLDPPAQVEPAAVQEHPDANVALASTGRVEGATETADVGAGVDGVIAELRVREGDTVRRGDILAIIARPELHQELIGARATAEAARQVRVRLLRGSRREERERAYAEVSAAEAVVRQAEAQDRRITNLFADGVVPAAERDEARRNVEVAKAELDTARKQAELVNAPPLPEEVARADADVSAAEARINVIEQMLEKCVVRAPIDGTVLRTRLKPGETFSLLVPQPIVTLADTSRLRVRAEVDERDVHRVFVGQYVRVRGDAWQGAGVTGRVNRIAAEMGRKTIRTGDPTDKSDRDVLEVVVDVDGNDPRLIMGLRVTVVFLKNPS